MVAIYDGTTYADLVDEFETGSYDYEKREYADRELPSDFPTEDEVLYCSFDGPGYEESIYLLFEKDGKLYEYEDFHCSCDGFQWSPQETTWEAVKMYGPYADDTELKSLVDSRLGTPGRLRASFASD